MIQIYNIVVSKQFHTKLPFIKINQKNDKNTTKIGGLSTVVSVYAAVAIITYYTQKNTYNMYQNCIICILCKLYICTIAIFCYLSMILMYGISHT